MPQFEERLVGDGDSIENWWDSSAVKSELFLVQMTTQNSMENWWDSSAVKSELFLVQMTTQN